MREEWRRAATDFQLNTCSKHIHPRARFIPHVASFGHLSGGPFRGSYRLVFDNNSLTYLAPNSMPDEIKPDPFIALPEPGTLSLASKGTDHDRPVSMGPVSMGIIVNFTTRIVQFRVYGLFYHEKITGLDDARVAFGEGEESGLIGTIDRMTGDTQINTVNGNSVYSLQCKPVQF